MRRTMSVRKEIKNSTHLKQLKNMFLPSLTKMAQLNGIDLSKSPDDSYFKIRPHMSEKHRGFVYVIVEFSPTKKIAKIEDKHFRCCFSLSDSVSEALEQAHDYTKNESYKDICSIYEKYKHIIGGDSLAEGAEVIRSIINHASYDEFHNCYVDCLKIINVFNNHFYTREHPSLKEFKNYLKLSFEKKVSKERTHLINFNLIIDKNVEKFEYVATATISNRKKHYADNIISGLNLIWTENDFVPLSNF